LQAEEPLLTIAEISVTLAIASGALVAAMLLLSAVDLVFPRGPAFLLIGLIWALLAAFAQLATFVLVTWSGMTEDRE